ncbi:MAG: extracellular solute-binding protein [Chloroflexota bacterium]|nr:extracellular solute-binding protein [Chloroflexota bacterium]
MRSQFWITLAVLLIATMVVGCVAPAVPAQLPAEPPTAEEAEPEAAAPAEEMNWWAEAAKAAGCVDTTIRGVSESTPPSTYAADVLAPAFTEETGIKVEHELTSWDQMYDKGIKDMEAGTGIYDYWYTEQDFIYAALANDYLTNISQLLEDNPELRYEGFDLSKFTTFIDNFKDPDTGDVYGVPMEAFIKINLYRKDLFEDADVQAAFNEQYGYDLAPATTFDQYRDNAEFFTKYAEENDMELWGTTVQAASGHVSSFYEVFETILPSFGVYNWGINMDNYKASEAEGGEMNSDRAKEALEFWVSMLEYAPPETTSSTWDEVAASFAAGRAAQGWIYGENAAWIATDPERSKVVGSVGVALPPVYEGVMEDAESGAGYIGYYDGGAFAMPHSSKNPLCSLLWLQYVGQEEVQPEWAVAGSRIVMDSTYDAPEVVEVDTITDGYFTMMEDQGYLFRGAPPFPFHAQVREVIAPFIWQAITGEMSAADAMDAAAAAADAELVNLGYGE